MPTLLQRLKQRKLFQWAAVYLAGAWLVFQGIEVLAEPWNLSGALQRTIHVLLAVGFFVTLILAWYHGEKGRQRASGVELLILAGILVIAGAAVTLLGRESQHISAGEHEAPPSTLDEKSIAVLPFANRSELQADEYFTDAMHDEILTRLSKIGALSVRGRTSVMQYRDSPKNLRQIGHELNARYVLEGGVQRAGETVRINLQLIDAATDEHVWAETYDHQLTVENLLNVQTDVALRVAEALKATLTADEAERIETRPTDDLEAYDFYVRGKKFAMEPGWRVENWRSAQRMFEQAVELDPSFASAHAWLSMVHGRMYWFRYDDSDDRLQDMRASAERALELDPGLPEAHLALGVYYYWGHRDYDRALEALARAEQGQPNDAELHSFKGAIYRRQGRWQQALAAWERSTALDPRNAEFLLELGDLHRHLRRYDEAESYYRQALAVEPEYGLAARRIAGINLLRDGNPEPLRALLSLQPERHLNLMWVEFFQRDYAAALAELSRINDEIISTENVYNPKSLYAGFIHYAAGQEELARSAFDSARVILEVAVSQRPDDVRRHRALGLAYAGLGRREAAIREGRTAVELLPLSVDAYIRGTSDQIALARIYTMVGEYDAAIDLVDYLLSIPSGVSVPLLRVDPTWDPLRDHPRFQALLARYE